MNPFLYFNMYSSSHLQLDVKQAVTQILLHTFTLYSHRAAVPSPTFLGTTPAHHCLSGYWVGDQTSCRGPRLAECPSMSPCLSVHLLISNLPMLLASQINVNAAGSHPELRAQTYNQLSVSVLTLEEWCVVCVNPDCTWFKFKLLFSLLSPSFFFVFCSCITILHGCDGPVSPQIDKFI